MVSLTREQILQVYEAGPDAVVDLVTGLLGIVVEHCQQLVEAQPVEAQLAKDSHNSSKPPASDGLKKPAPKSLRSQSAKKLGAQPGHPRTTLCWSQSPDQIIEHRPTHCPTCGEQLSPTDTLCVERRQVYDLPPLRLLVSEHQAYPCRCPACHQQTKAQFLTGIEAALQYSAQVKALAVYLTGPEHRASQSTGPDGYFCARAACF